MGFNARFYEELFKIQVDETILFCVANGFELLKRFLYCSLVLDAFMWDTNGLLMPIYGRKFC